LKMAEFPTCRARDLDLDLGSGHTAYHHASLIDLYLIQNFVAIEETFLDGGTDGRTDKRMDGHLRPTLLGRLGGVDLKTAVENGKRE